MSFHRRFGRLYGMLFAFIALSSCTGSSNGRDRTTPPPRVTDGSSRPVDTTDHIALFAPDWASDSARRSDEAWEEAAQTYDVLIGLGITYKDRMQRLREVNPSLTLLWYNLGPYLQEDSPVYQRVMEEHPEYFARDSEGKLITVPMFPRNTLMDQGNEGWRSLHLSLIREALERWPFDGVFVDSMGPNALTGYTTGKPVNPRTRRPYTTDQWLRLSVSTLNQIKEGLGERFVIFNGLGSGPVYSDTSRVLASSLADGGMAEGFVRGSFTPVTKYPSPSAWKANLDMVVDMESRGKAMFAWTKTWAPATNSEREAWGRFALATYLLGKGSNSFFAFLPSQEGDRTTLFHGDMRADLGSPIGPYTESAGIFSRRFENGSVTVDPRSHTASIEPED